MPVYLDNAATTQVRNEVVDKMAAVLKSNYGNPSSTHSVGRSSKSILEQCRKRIAAQFNVKSSEIVFTAGGTEADNLVLRSAVCHLDVKHIISSRIERQEYKPIINIENHDTIGMLCIDKNNNLSGACTSSGLAYKMKGRVGDSPIIGSGLFIDNKIGGAVATGLGEEVVKTVGSFLVVELMRQGLSPQEACEKAIKRIVSNNSQKNKFQVAYIAMNKKGEIGSYSIEPGFTFMDYVKGENKEVFSKSEL